MNTDIDERTDKPECFAWIDNKTCNALCEKKCKYCSFYKHKDEVPGYSKYKPTKKDKK